MTERLSIWLELSDVDYCLHHVDVGPWSTRVLDTGGTKQPMVLMHGTGGHLEAYSRNIAHLAQDFRVIAFDSPGHGYSTHATELLELDTYIDHLDGFLSTLDLRDVVLNGESLGGWVAIKYTAKHPERIDKLILNTPGGTMATPEVMERIRTLSQAAADDPNPQRIRERLEWLMADNTSVTEELVDVRRRIYSREGFSTSMTQILCLQDPDIRQRNLVTDDELTSIDQPALVIWTSDDPSGPAAAGMEMAEKLPNGQFVLVEGAGHWPQWEQPERFHEAIAGFIGSA